MKYENHPTLFNTMHIISIAACIAGIAGIAYHYYDIARFLIIGLNL